MLTCAASSAVANSGNNRIRVNQPSPVNNVLIGTASSNSLSGGTGAENFRFDSSLPGLSNVDQITVFNMAESDRIPLGNSIFTALPTSGTDRIRFKPLNNALLYDPDGSKPIAPTAFATVTPGLTLSNLQFVIT